MKGKIVHEMAFGAGNGTQLHNPASNWVLNLDWSPTPGNTLILAMSLPGYQGIEEIAFGLEFDLNLVHWADSWAVFTTTIPDPSPTQITAIGGLFNTPGFVMEVANLSNIMPVVNLSGQGGPTSTYDTTESAVGITTPVFALNMWSYYNDAVHSNPMGSAPSDGYTLHSGGTPIQGKKPGWAPSPDSGSADPTYSYGVLFAHLSADALATAGGTVTDSKSLSNYYAAAALVWPVTAG